MNVSGEDNVLNIKIEDTSGVIDVTDCDVKQEIFNAACTVCRTITNLRSITDTYYHQGKPEKYSEMLLYCFRIKSEDLQKSGLCSICHDCVERLRDATDFRRELENSINKFKYLLDDKPISYDEEEYIVASQTLPISFIDAGHHSDENDNLDTGTNKLVSPKTPKMPTGITVFKKIADRRQISINIRQNPLMPVPPSKLTVKQAAVKFNIPGCIQLKTVSGGESNEKTNVSSAGKLHIKTVAKHNGNKLIKRVAKRSKNETEPTEISGKIFNLPIVVRGIDQQRTVTPISVSTKAKEHILQINDLVNNTDLKCRICNEEFLYNKFLKRHISIHYPNHVCETCGNLSATYKQYQAHLQTHKTKVYACKECPDKKYRSAGSLGVHMKVKHRGQNKLFRCPKCGERFVRFSQRRSHLIEVHGQPDDDYTCKQCSKKFNSSNTLQKHVRFVHLKERNHACEQCGREFGTKAMMIQHMLCHTTIANLPCQYCGKRFKRKKTLKEHVKIHTGEKKHVCNVCGRAFTQGCTLRGHMAVHNRENKTDKTDI